MRFFGHYCESDRLKDLGLTVRSYNYCLSRGITTVKELLEYYSANNNTIPTGQNAGYTTVSELTRFCEGFSHQNSEPEEDKQNDLSAWGLSVRAQNVLQSYQLTTKQALLEFFVNNNQSIPDSLRNCGRKTKDEITQFCQYLIKSGNIVMRSSEDSIDSNETKPHNDVQGELNTTLKLLRPFSRFVSLPSEDVEFLSSFHTHNGHFPYIWLLSRIIDSDKDLALFAYVYGIDYKKGRRTIGELAIKEDVTQSRIGQRVSTGYNKLFGRNAPFTSAFKHADVSYLFRSIDQQDYLSSEGNNKYITELNNHEGTSFTDEFILKFLSCIRDDFECLGDIQKKNHPHILRVIRKDLYDALDFEGIFKDLDSVVEEASEERDLNLKEFVEDSSRWSFFSMNYVDRVLRIVKSYLLTQFGLYEDSVKNVIHILPRKFDIKEIVFSIVRESSAPLSLKEIIEIASKQYPLCTFNEDVVRLILKDDTRIQFVREGIQQVKYLLANTNAPTSIRDAIVRILNNSSDPVPLDQIVSYVLVFFPRSSRNSIRTSIQNDTQNRFVQFENGLYGLTSKNYPDTFIRVDDASRLSFADRLILLKQFIDDKQFFPFRESADEQEVDLAKWLERNKDRQEVRDLIDRNAPIIWKKNCKRCEEYITSHDGRVPPKDREPRLYSWLLKSSEEMRDDLLNQEQRKMFLRLTFQIKR